MNRKLVLVLFAMLLAGAVSVAGCASSGGGEKAPDCTITKNCPTGTHCNPNTGLCEPDDPCDLCNPNSEVCWRDVCYQKCESAADCPLGFDCNPQFHGCVEIPQDGDLELDATEQEAEEEEAGCGNQCTSKEICWSADGQTYACYKKCNPFEPECPSPQICWLPFDENLLPKTEGICRYPLEDAAGEGETCSEDTPCQLNLVCYHGTCRAVCDAWGDKVCPIEHRKCKPVPSMEMGVCEPEEEEPQCNNTDKPCPDGFACVGGVCVPGTACTSDADCPGTFVCDYGICIESCLYMGCPSHKPTCDKETGHCTRETIACGGGCGTQYFCEDGRCWPKCDPPCTGRQYCKHGATPRDESTCVEPTDCRTVGGCPPGTECDQRTGFCVKRCPASCTPPTCCDYTTDYTCGNCESGVCSSLNPNGPCPLLDQKCVNGQCHTDPNICIPDGYPCSPASHCCSADADATIKCCVDATDPNLIGICCAAGQTCVPVLKMCL